MPKSFDFSNKDLDPLEAVKIYKEETGEADVREDMEDNGKIDIQTSSKEVVWQEMTAIKQEYQETFSKEESEEYFKRLHAKRKEYRTFK
jgi:hypothetical protein